MNVVLLETIHESALQLILNHGFNIFYAYDEEALAQVDKSSIHAIITRGKGQVRKNLIDQCTNLKAIARCGVGLENIDVVYAQSKQIEVYNAPGSNTMTTAEHTIALMLSLVRNIHAAVNANKSFDFSYRNQYQEEEIYGKQLGIIGLGNIGSRVASIAQALGMHVSYFSPNQKNDNFGFKPLDDLLATSDVISLHLPLTDATHEYVDKNFLSKMKSNAYLINTCRTEMINIHDVLQALDSNGKLKAYASDCPMRYDSVELRTLIAHPRTLITPHIASLTAGTYRQMCVVTVEKLLKYFEK
jgi:lactate dehydrogenase-like 2-hydroxyacid dehydrogenase